jgi:hypothetical protein
LILPSFIPPTLFRLSHKTILLSPYLQEHQLFNGFDHPDSLQNEAGSFHSPSDQKMQLFSKAIPHSL